MPKKQTSSRVSTIAAHVLASTAHTEPKWPVSFTEADSGITDVCTVADLRAVCASALSQDETRGQTRTNVTFERAWAKKERLGYRYGGDALEQVRFGWQLREEHPFDSDVAHTREAAAILRALVSSAAMDGSAQKLARAWLRKDEKLRAQKRPVKRRSKA